MQKFICYFTVFASFYFEFEGNQSTSPGLYLEGRSDLSEGFLRYEFGGGGGSLYLEGLIFGVLRYVSV